MSQTTIPGLIYDYIKAGEGKVINHISPSMIGRCMRAHFFAIKHIPQTTPPNPGALANFKVGFLWEQVMAEAIEHAKLEHEFQKKILDKELNVEGTADFVVKVDGEWEVWDSKTESISASLYRNRSRETFFMAHPEYVHQLNLYCILLRRADIDIKKGRFGVITKDNGMIVESITMFENSSLQKTLERVKELNGYLERDELPPCSCEGWTVNYCNWGKVGSIRANNKGKMVPFECCEEALYVTDVS